MAANPFHPVMTHFTLPLHAARGELVALAAGWADEHGLHVGIERYHPRYVPAAPPCGAALDAATPGASSWSSSRSRRTVCARMALPDHFHAAGAHELSAGGVPMLAATGPAAFVFDDLA